MTYRNREQVSVVVRIVSLAEERYKRVTASTAVGLRLAATCIRPHIVGRQNNIILLVTREPLIGLTVQLCTYQEVGAVLADLQIIGDNSVPHPLQPMLLLGFNGVLVVGYHTLVDGVGEESLLLLRIVDTRRGADIQTFDGSDVYKYVTEYAPIDVAVILVALQNRQRVLALRESAG